MASIFNDSLQHHKNVCNGCFKTIYVLALEIADSLDIKYIFTGLSRGQLFETRLDDLYDRDEIAVESFDQMIHQARVAYHSMPDAVTRCLGNRVIKDNILARVQFIDFYRYVDVSLDQVMDYLNGHTPWQRPPDTGRSTNCLINEAGIYVHQRERGYHNYALAYSWDVRIGHKNRQQALDELNDDINADKVQRILDDVGYHSDEPVPSHENVVAPKASPATSEIAKRKQLTAWIVPNGESEDNTLRSALSHVLPGALVPTRIVRIDHIPLTPNGKTNFTRLRQLVDSPVAPAFAEAAANAIEARVLDVWRTVFDNNAIGMGDDFFQLGGDSLIAVHISQRLIQHNLRIDATQMFIHTTPRRLAEFAKNAGADADRNVPEYSPQVNVEVSLSDEELTELSHELGDL
jgi:hypothetical protein